MKELMVSSGKVCPLISSNRRQDDHVLQPMWIVLWECVRSLIENLVHVLVEVCIWMYSQIPLLCAPNVEGIGRDTEFQDRWSPDSLLCWRYVTVVCAISDGTFVNMHAGGIEVFGFHSLLADMIEEYILNVELCKQLAVSRTQFIEKTILDAWYLYPVMHAHNSCVWYLQAIFLDTIHISIKSTPMSENLMSYIVNHKYKNLNKQS